MSASPHATLAQAQAPYHITGALGVRIVKLNIRMVVLMSQAQLGTANASWRTAQFSIYKSMPATDVLPSWHETYRLWFRTGPWSGRSGACGAV